MTGQIHSPPFTTPQSHTTAMNPLTIQAVQHSWAQVKPIEVQAAALFYRELFSRDPALQPLFKGDMAAQGHKLMQMIGAAVAKLHDLPTLLPVLQALGRRHQGYGVIDRHYATVGAALLATLALGLGPQFTPEVEAAWTEVYLLLANVMQTAAATA